MIQVTTEVMLDLKVVSSTCRQRELLERHDLDSAVVNNHRFPSNLHGVVDRGNGSDLLFALQFHIIERFADHVFLGIDAHIECKVHFP